MLQTRSSVLPVLAALKDVTKVYGSGESALNALNGANLAIAPGEFVAIMGPSGSGKSAAMNILGCLDTPSSGVYLFEGVNAGALPRAARAMLRRHFLGLVSRDFRLLPLTSAIENVELPLIYRGLPLSERRRLAAAALARTGLEGCEQHTPAELAEAGLRRLALARAIVTSPHVLLADEPAANLDTKGSREIMGLMTTLNRDLGLTIVMVTHQQEMAAYAGRIVRFADGRVASDTPNTPPA
jgi:putative ABC transport system ATP-binding protein